MKTAQHPLSAVKSMLLDIVRDSDDARLAECLSGKFLPALGGQEHPADVVNRAVSLPPYDPDLPRELAPLTATLCMRRAAALEQALRASGRLLDDEAYVFNLLLFASYLPAEEALFRALKTFHAVGLRAGALFTGAGRSGRQLRQALIYQQADDSLEDHWLALMRRREALIGDLSSERKSDLLAAWQGLLWIPPSPAEREAGATLSVDRAVRGLRALHDAAGTSADGVLILRHAVRRLSEAYPRSAEFFSDHLGPRLDEWPELLREVAVEQWPLLATAAATGIVQAGAREIWHTLSSEQRSRIEQGAAGDPEAWKSLWQRELFFLPPRAGLSRQQWVMGLKSVRGAFEGRFPTLAGGTARPSLGEIAEAERDRGGAPGQPARPRYTDRPAAYERVRKVLGEVDQLLGRNRPARARRYLNDLLRSQKRAETRPELIAKTLCSAAATALSHGHPGWAEELYHRAVDLGVDDPVPGTGLAEVLKAQDRLEESETLYWQTSERFPDDVVARNGLAEVLKVQDRLEESEPLYRQTCERFPDNVVARTGLAEVLKARDRLEESETLYRQTCERFPGDVVARTGLAEVLKAQDRLEESETLYRQTCERFPDNVFARNGLAEVLKARGRLGESETLYRQTSERFPSDRVCKHGLANLLRLQKRFDEALSLLPAPAALDSRRNMYDLHLHGLILLGSGAAAAAVEIFERAVEAPISSRRKAHFRSALITARLKQKRYQDALGDLETIEAATPELQTLELHAAAGAGAGAGADARQLHTRLSADVLSFKKVVRDSIRLIDKAWGLSRAGEELRQPAEDELEVVVEAEIEMLLAA